MIYLAWKAQIALLIIKKVIVLKKYLDYADVFSKELTEILLERKEINEHAIK